MFKRFVNLLATGNLWDPWTKPWNMFLDIFGEEKYSLYVFGITIGEKIMVSLKCLIFRHNNFHHNLLLDRRIWISVYRPDRLSKISGQI